MARFHSRLNSDITNIVELHHYGTLNELVQLAMKIEKQLKRKNLAKYGGIPYSAIKTTLKSSLDTNSKGKKSYS